jgi:DNA-binding SARP family transcriptional activator
VTGVGGPPTAALVLAAERLSTRLRQLQDEAPRLDAPTLAVNILAMVRVRLNGTAVDDWPSGRGRSLLKYLLTHRDPWPRREVLMDIFWPGSPPAAARNSLNVAVHGLRRALRASADLPVVVLRDGAYRLAADLRLWVDVDQFQRHAGAARRLEQCGRRPTP